MEIRKYQNANGQVPFDDWMSTLTDNRARKRIKIRIDGLMIGLEGDWKPVGAGVREMRIPEERLPW